MLAAGREVAERCLPVIMPLIVRPSSQGALWTIKLVSVLLPG